MLRGFRNPKPVTLTQTLKYNCFRGTGAGSGESVRPSFVFAGALGF